MLASALLLQPFEASASELLSDGTAEIISAPEVIADEAPLLSEEILVPEEETGEGSEEETSILLDDNAEEEVSPEAGSDWVYPLSGQCGENVFWSWEGDMLRFYGNGPMYDEDYLNSHGLNECLKYRHVHGDDNPWKYVVIEEGVTTVADYLCSTFYYLENIEIADSVTKIGSSAFSSCSSLKTVSLPAGVTEIGNYAFLGCSRLISINIPDGVEVIHQCTFQQCTSLPYIELPEGVTVIEDSAFQACMKLEGIVIPEKVTVIGVRAFQNCESLESITIPAAATSIGYNAFNCCTSLKTITLPDSITSIPSGCFRACKSLSDICIPDNVTTIENNAFYYCADMTGIEIPRSVKYIRMSAFEDCSSLQDVNYAGSEKEWESIQIAEGNECLTNAVIHFNSHSADPSPAPVPPFYNGGFRFRSVMGNYDAEAQCSYNDNYFRNTEPKYDHDLARMSLALAMSAFNSAKMPQKTEHTDADLYTYENPDPEYRLENTPARNVAELMHNCGFGNIAVNEDYLITTEYDEDLNHGDNMGVCIGSKQLDGCTLIAVALRGAGYGDEWIGDFNVYGSGDEHIGFQIAAAKVRRELLSYIEKKEIGGRVKVWITGYSRSAAVANLTAAGIIKNGLGRTGMTQSDLYAYTFATPQGTKTKEEYSGIWNIVNPNDIVPCVAMDRWGYGRYGKTKYLPSRSTQAGRYNSLWSSVVNNYNDYTGAGITEIPQISLQVDRIRTITDAVAFASGSENSDLALTVQYEISRVFQDNGPSAELMGFGIGSAALIGVIMGVPSLIKHGITLASDMSTIIKSHHPELYYAWMNAVPASFGLADDFKAVVWKTNCPVDLEVYDENNDFQLEIIDDIIYENENCCVEAMVDEDGQKVIGIPEDVNVRIRFIATGNGELNCSVQEMSLEGGSAEKVTNYYDIGIAAGDVLEGTVDSVYTSEDDRVSLSSPEGAEITPDEVLNGVEICYCTVEVRTDGAGKAEGDAIKTCGEFAQVSAEPESGAAFSGWYDEYGTLLSKEPVYRFAVTADTVITARFTREDAPEILFDDVQDPKAFYYEPVYWAVGEGITTGYKDSDGDPAGKFGPGDKCTREQIVTFLWRMMGCPESDFHPAFKDIRPDAYYYRAVAWAAEKGITTGVSEERFGVGDFCTREMCVTFLYRAAGEPPVTGSDIKFTDIVSGSYYEKAVEWASANGATTGYKDASGNLTGRFGVKDHCKRGEIVTFLYRFANL